MNAIIFARGYDVGGQVDKGMQYAEKKGYAVVGVIVGQGRDLPAVIDGLGIKVNRVIVRDMARLSRNALENYTVQSELEIDYGVLVEDVSAKERNEVQEKLMRNIIEAVQNESKRAKTVEQIRRRLLYHGAIKE